MGVIAATVAGVAGALVAATAIGARWIAVRYPPTGRFAEVDGVRLHHLDLQPAVGADPDRPPVLLIHGASSTLDDLCGSLADSLPGRRLILVDRPGHGHSTRGARAMAAPADQARILKGLLDHLGVGQVVVVGHSLGGAVAAAFAVLYPTTVAGLVLLAPATHPWPGGVTWYYTVAQHRWIGRLFSWTLALPLGALAMTAAARGVFAPDPMPADYVQRARIALVLRPASFVANALDVADLKGNVTAMAPRYPGITAPTVIITGDRDSVVLPSIHSDGLKRDIAGAELIVLGGVGHMPHHARPEVVAAAIERVGARADRVAAGD